MDNTILEDIGLTGAEIKVFIALIETGSTTAGKIVEKSKLQNAVVHRAFHSLLEKGLITFIYQGKIKVYQAIEPKLLLNFLDEKKFQLEKIIPELEAKKALQKEKPRATIFQGIRGLKELINLMIDTDSKEYFSYGGSKKANELLGEHFWENFHRRKINKKIYSKVLFHSSLKYWAKTLREYPLITIKFTDKNFEELTETIICGNRVAVIIWLNEPFGFLIDEELASRSYKKFFEILWKHAKK